MPLAVEIGRSASARPSAIWRGPSASSHERQIRVAMRISCFEDELVAKAKPSLLPLSKWKRPYPIGWLDPANPEAQQYVLDLAKEAIERRCRRDPARLRSLPGARHQERRLRSRPRARPPRPIVIRDFVRKVHELTQARNVPLSLDIFGVVAEGHRDDINMLGQDPALLAPECEALSPMVYPSHYRSGYQGWEIPGNHPEIVGIGTRKILSRSRRPKARWFAPGCRR